MRKHLYWVWSFSGISSRIQPLAHSAICHGHFTLKQLRLPVLNEMHTNSCTGPTIYRSCHALKIKSTQIIFKQETHSNVISTLTIAKKTSSNFDDKKYIITEAQHQYHSIVG